MLLFAIFFESLACSESTALAVIEMRVSVPRAVVALLEELVEQVIHVHVRASAPSGSSGLLIPYGILPSQIIGFPLLWILERLICQCYFLELFPGLLRLIFVPVRMIFECQLLELLSDCFVVCVPLHPQ